MFGKIAIQMIDTKIEVLIISAIFIALPANLVLSLTAAAYLVQITGNGFFITSLAVFLPTIVIPILAGFIFVYPFEVRVVRFRATESLRWAAIRIGWIMLISIPVGIISLEFTRTVASDYVPLIKRIPTVYVFTALIEGFMIGVVTVFFEKVFAEIVKREENLRRQITELQISIDKNKQKTDVADIEKSDVFQDLQARAKDMRDKRSHK